jgi:adenylate cyclase class 2
MSLEIEAKFRVDSHDAVRARLEALGAERLGAVKEINHIFDNSEHSLLAADCGLRVRAIEVIDGEPQAATITYKGPRQPGALKVREEIETTVGDAGPARGILRALGFTEAVRFEKRRESWRWGGCEIELDELPHLGCYVEIEGPKETAVTRAQGELGLEAAEPIRASYIALLIDYCRGHGLNTRRVTFAEERNTDDA